MLYKKTSNLLVLLIILFEIIFEINSVEVTPLGTRFEISDSEQLDTFDLDKNVYIVDFRKNDNSKKIFELTCLTGPDSLDLNLTFTGFNSILKRVN
jgi:hypothetical protein